MSAYRRVGVSACRRVRAQHKIHTKATEVRKGHEGLRGFRIYEELVFARSGAVAYMLCAVLKTSHLRVDLLYADTPIRSFPPLELHWEPKGAM